MMYKFNRDVCDAKDSAILLYAYRISSNKSCILTKAWPKIKAGVLF